ncbi:MAG: alpha/beta fold hydrolase [Cytophagales bacterium]|nr:MAG: alpha/beta fold hydrolase [Cytophagales bacterium]
MSLYFRKLGLGKPLIILHGLFGSSDNWLSVSKLLAENFEIFLIDLRNHGQSPHFDLHTYEEMAKDVIDFLDEQNIENPIILGHSMGGKVAMKLAELYANQIKKLIIVDISPKFYPPHHQREISALQNIDLLLLKSRQEADEIMSKSISELGIRQFLLKNLYRNVDGTFHWRMNLEVLIKQIENIGASSNRFSSVIPTLFIKGENSNYINDDDVLEIKKIFSVSKIITISNAGHWVQAEQPILFKDAVLNFLNL